MSSVRLYKRQIDRFSHGNGAKVIACALRRYRDGELVIGSGSFRSISSRRSSHEKET